MDRNWAGKNTHNRALNFYPIFIPLFEGKVSGVSVQDMLLRLPFLTPYMKLHFKSWSWFYPGLLCIL